jgi:hypothetical protein
MTRKICVYWRDIPSQLIVQRGRQREKMLLSARFQEAIDRAAMRAGKGASDAYIAEWRRETIPCEADGELRQGRRRVATNRGARSGEARVRVQRRTAARTRQKPRFGRRNLVVYRMRNWSVRNAWWLKRAYAGLETVLVWFNSTSRLRWSKR